MARGCVPDVVCRVGVDLGSNFQKRVDNEGTF